MSVVEKLRLLEIWATRKGLWIYIKMTMGCLGEGLKDPKKRGGGEMGPVTGETHLQKRSVCR